MEQKNKYIEVAGALMPADPEVIAQWINDRHPNVDEVVRPYEIAAALGNEIEVFETAEGDKVDTKQLWTFVDTNVDTQGYMEFADNEAYKRVYGEVTGDTYDKHKKQIQRLSKYPDNAIHRPLRTSKPTTTSNSFSYFMDCLHNSKPRHKEGLKQSIINYVDELRFKGMSTKRAIRVAAGNFQTPPSTIEKWTYL